jgi:cytochrome o ubiquinol oxidase operon protein cyoD
MSAPASPAHAGDRDARVEGHGARDEGGGGIHATLRGYLTGFVLSVVLTAIPFWLVMSKVLDKPSATALVLLGLAAVQIVVHMIYFLHMNSKSEGGWTMLALIFTLVLVFITLIGSLWVMYHLNQNMMPVSVQQMRNMP